MKAEFIMVGLKGDCIHLTSSWLFLSGDEIEDLKGNFRLFTFFKILIFVFPNLSAADGERVEGLCCVAAFQPCAGVWLRLSLRHYIQCLIP